MDLHCQILSPTIEILRSVVEGFGEGGLDESARLCGRGAKG
jgi:hypothetical protein